MLLGQNLRRCHQAPLENRLRPQAAWPRSPPPFCRNQHRLAATGSSGCCERRSPRSSSMTRACAFVRSKGKARRKSFEQVARSAMNRPARAAGVVPGVKQAASASRKIRPETSASRALRERFVVGRKMDFTQGCAGSTRMRYSGDNGISQRRRSSHSSAAGRSIPARLAAKDLQSPDKSA